MGNYDVVFIDADDTLFDYAAAERFSLEQSFGEWELPYSDSVLELYAAVNKKLWAEYEQGTVTQEDLRVIRFEKIFGELGIGGDPGVFSKVYLSWLARSSFLLPGAEKICAYLSGKYTTAVITNGIRDVQVSRIRDSAIRDYIGSLIVSEEAGCAKPNPAIFEYAAEKLRYKDKERMIMVGDSLSSDIQGGINYGIDTCWINAKQLEVPGNIRPTYCIRSLEEITDIL
ncbi:YjjG family noncanonical pyrimidine nucleotidase [Breznakiella homolactica]|uniref:YjjG family noncanonical pyrimidine nucleotidase n=1 Tax=Breznakiella homolactica TaxID=2798577 RepID=A0A7T7XPQ7_9SPIR|nr:YjjG family noncanonical pyrimidine nucleotidase [Breznakiella homolactica]QQO10240.1 YjjG family noncanonical pyrimidine nucleotidase [Breznakiella homolactica]